MAKIALRPVYAGTMAPPFEALAVAALFVVVTAIAGVTQPRWEAEGGLGADGAYYVRVAQELARGEPPRASAPFVYRVGTPFLAGVVLGDPGPAGFLVVNLVGIALATALLAVWLGRHVQDWRLRVLLVAVWLGMWHAPARFTWFIPAMTDAWGDVFLLGALLLAERPRLLALSVVCGLGVLFREFVAVVPLGVLAGTLLRRSWRQAGLAALPLLCSSGLPAGCSTRGRISTWLPGWARSVRSCWCSCSPRSRRWHSSATG